MLLSVGDGRTPGARPFCCSLCCYCVPKGRQRNGGTEDVVGVVLLFDPDQPFCVGPKAVRRTIRLAWAEQIRISARKRDRVEGMPDIPDPLLMPPLFPSVRPIAERRQYVDQDVLAPPPEL